MLCNWKPHIIMLKLLLAIKIVAIMVKIVINMAMSGIQSKSMKHTNSAMLNSYQWDLSSRRYQNFHSFVIFTALLQCRNIDSLRQLL